MRYINFLFLFLLLACNETTTEQTQSQAQQAATTPERLPVLFDTDVNNELDDQHALAYLLFNQDVFDIKGITVNTTRNGGAIENHYKEARRVMDLCGIGEEIPLLIGADKDFEVIRPNLKEKQFDGHAAVNFIIAEAKKERAEKLVLVPVGKLTNIALALEKAPEIKDKVRIVWLGSNYPEPGEYNLKDDPASLKYILEQAVDFEMTTVRYNTNTGATAVKTDTAEINAKMPGKGVVVEAVEGRHGGQFTTFGDYSVSLFSNAQMHGNPPGRSLFDLVTVATLKNPNWGEQKVIPTPNFDPATESWTDHPESKDSITIWENFDKEGILTDFFETIQNAGQ